MFYIQFFVCLLLCVLVFCPGPLISLWLELKKKKKKNGGKKQESPARCRNKIIIRHKGKTEELLQLNLVKLKLRGYVQAARGLRVHLRHTAHSFIMVREKCGNLGRAQCGEAGESREVEGLREK